MSTKEKTKKNKQFYVYILTFPNGKRYIGQTCQRPDTRWAGGKGYGNGQPVRRAIDIHGWDNVQHEVYASGLSSSEADRIEKELIKLLKSSVRENGYNVLPGGVINRTGFTNTEEQNRKIAESHKKPVNQFTRNGRLVKTYDSIMDAADAVCGSFRVVSSVCNGTKKTGYGYVWRFVGDPVDKYIVEPVIGGHKGRPVVAFDMDGNETARFRSSKHAEKMTGLTHEGILRCCRGRTCSYGGYVWKFVEEDEDDE